MRLQRGILAGVVLVSLGVVVSVVFLSTNFLRRPDPQTASRAELVRWLAIYDVAAEPDDFQLGMIDRLETEIRGGLDGSASDMLPESARQQLEDNARHLKRRWFVWRVNQYAELDPAAGPAFLDREIETVLAWAKLEEQLSSAPEVETEAGSSAAAFFGDIEAWMDAEQDAAQRRRMSRGVHDGLLRWLATRDLAEQPMAVREQLANRIAESLQRRGPESMTANQPDRDDAQLRSNGLLLIEAWLLGKSREFSGLAMPERISFVDQQIDDVLRLGVLNLVAPRSPEQPAEASPLSGATKLLAQVEEWIKRAPPEDQPSLRDMANLVQARLAMRWLTGSLRLGS